MSIDHPWKDEIQKTDGASSLGSLKARCQRRRKLLIQQKDLAARISDLTAQEQSLAARLCEEREDVEKLRAGGLLNYVYRLTGSMEERLSKEQREVSEAAVRHETAAGYLEDARRALRSVEEELKGLESCEEEYELAKEARREELKRSGSPRWQEIERIQEELSEAQGQVKELAEAVEAGQRAMTLIGYVKEDLKSAESYGAWDCLGGGLFVTMAKHEHLDSAQTNVERLQAQLGRFRTELADVAVQADLQIQIDGFLRFADYFFDGIFADWAVMKRINEAQDKVHAVERQVNMVLGRLRERKSELEQESGRLKGRLEELIVE